MNTQVFYLYIYIYIYIYEREREAARAVVHIIQNLVFRIQIKSYSGSVIATEDYSTSQPPRQLPATFHCEERYL